MTSSGAERVRRLTMLVWLLATLACLDRSRSAPWPEVGRLPSTWVEVRLAESPVEQLACQGPWTLHALDGTRLQAGASLPPRTELRPIEGGLRLGPFELPTSGFELRPGPGSRLQIGSRSYRGLLRVDRVPARPGEPAAVRLSNRLSVEDYLLGVLPGEMPDRFGLAALKAQAVAARSYALAEMLDRGWLRDDARSQVYGGRSVETSLASEAVRKTRGLVLVAGKHVLTAWFHSTCGGSTRPAREVFPNPAPGVMEESVLCTDCRASTYWRWTRTLPLEHVRAALDLPAAWVPGALRATPDRWPAYAQEIRLGVGAEIRTWSADRFRSKLARGLPLAQQPLSVRWTTAPRLSAEGLRLSGAGWGHGVGLCQYGAAGAAARGWDERQILERYYPGAQLVRIQ